MNTTTDTTDTTDQTTGIRAATQVRVILTLFVAMLATLIALAPSASAEPALDLELVEIDEWEPELPEIPEHEIVLIDPELLEELPWLFLLTADATVDCADNGAIDIEIGNQTADFTMLQVFIDDIVVANPTVGPNMAWIDTFPAAAENSTVNVRVEGDITVLDTALAGERFDRLGRREQLQVHRRHGHRPDCRQGDEEPNGSRHTSIQLGYTIPLMTGGRGFFRLAVIYCFSHGQSSRRGI